MASLSIIEHYSTCEGLENPEHVNLSATSMSITKINAVILLLLISFSLMALVPTCAWSVEGHQLITKHAMEWLPRPWKQLFNYYGWFLTEAVAYPDTYYRGTDPNESPRHYVDLEVWDPNEPSTGTLPQAVEEFTHRMQLALEVGDWNDAFLLAGRVAHYVEDATQPYHSTVNYNPVNRAGVELHAVLDSSLMDHSSEIQIQTPSNSEALNPVENLTEFALSIAVQSHSFLPTINETLINEGLDWSPELTKIVENRTNTAITAVARVWYTAIVRANSPAPNMPSPNELSIILENTSLTDNGLVVIRLRVVDSLRVGTYANVTLTTDGASFRGQVANVVPPLGEYVIVSETGLHPNDSLTAQREGYVGAVRSVNVTVGNITPQSRSVVTVTSLQTQRGARPLPVVTIAALAVMLAGILALVILHKTSRDS
jgi:hypothetical protein